MKLAHLADLHLGFRRYTRQTTRGVNQREADVATAFRRAVDDVVAARPDAVVVAGDVFHAVRPTNPAILDSLYQLRRLRNGLPEVPIIIIAGDHDTPRSVETGTILKLFEMLPGIHVAVAEPQTFVFEDLDLAVLCVPHAAVRTSLRPTMRPEPGSRWNVLLTHGEVAGVAPGDRSFVEYGGALMEPGELHAEQWNYVALGHYHVAQQVTPNAWYAGSLEFVSLNPWGELHEGARLGWGGAKGWLLATLREGLASVEFMPIDISRRHIDLEPIEGRGQSAGELDELIAARVAGVPEGIDDQILRQVVSDVPRHVARDLDHAAVRDLKTRAVHYHLDLRRPEIRREVGVGAPGHRQTLRELVTGYLERRELVSGVDRDTLVALGRHYLDLVERDSVEE